MDINRRRAEQMLRIDRGNRCGETGLDCRKARQVGQETGIVRHGVGCEDLRFFFLLRE